MFTSRSPNVVLAIVHKEHKKYTQSEMYTLHSHKDVGRNPIFRAISASGKQHGRITIWQPCLHSADCDLISGGQRSGGKEVALTPRWTPVLSSACLPLSTSLSTNVSDGNGWSLSEQGFITVKAALCGGLPLGATPGRDSCDCWRKRSACRPPCLH